VHDASLVVALDLSGHDVVARNVACNHGGPLQSERPAASRPVALESD